MELYILIAKLAANFKNKYEDYRILKFDNQIPIGQQVPEGFVKILGPSSLEDCVKHLKQISENASNWFGLTVAQYALIFLVTLALVGVISAGAWNLPNFNTQKDTAGNLISDPDNSARILITFLVAVGTIAIAFLTILTAMVIREYKERFALAKEVLTILVGILGTIVGFYFGTAKATKPNPPDTNTAINANVSNSGNTTNTNTNSNTSINSNTNSNARTHILRLPSGREKLVSFNYSKAGKQKIVMQ